MPVSIVVCCYNHAHMLPQTMASIFAQEYQPAEIVVLDDGSTDNTAELMAGYGDRTRYYHQDNQGIAAPATMPVVWRRVNTSPLSMMTI